MTPRRTDSDREGAAGSFSRRSFLKGASAAAASGAMLSASAAPPGTAPPTTTRRFGTGTHEITLSVNGAKRKIEVETRTTLLEALRIKLDLTGSKEVCDRGSCGACTVWMDGKTVNACMTLAMDAVGAEITTIEALAADGKLHPVQEAFVQCDALQCGYCTPGMVMSGVALLGKHENPTLAQMKHELSGNICRCGTYTRVFEAIQRTANGRIKTRRAVR